MQPCRQGDRGDLLQLSAKGLFNSFYCQEYPIWAGIYMHRILLIIASQSTHQHRDISNRDPNEKLF